MRTLLLDSDIIAFKVAAANEEITAFGKSVSPLKRALDACDETIDELVKKLKADDVIVCLSCREDNWRLQHLDSYKHNRDPNDPNRPDQLSAVKEHMADNYETYLRHSLEADDVMGILATHEKLIPGEKIVVSEDKDLRTVPCSLYAPHRSELGVQRITPLQARQFHMWQTICGDPTDGYKGAPGLGKGSLFAEECLQADMDELWDVVLAAFGAVGQTETEALQQARVAQILTAGWYDFKNKEAVPFEPEVLDWF